MKARARLIGTVLGALATGFVAALTSCNLIVGVGDYAVGDGATDGTTAPSDGGTTVDDAPTSWGTDAIDIPPEAEADSQSTAMPDTGGPVTEGGGPDSAPSCARKPPTGQAFQNIVNACVLAVSCDPFFYNVNISGCITYDFLHSSGSVACLSTIQDCNGYFNCTGTRYATAAECPTGTTAQTCDATGTLAIDCQNQAVHDCKKEGTGVPCQTYVDRTGTTHAGCAVVPSCRPTDGGFECTQDKSTSYSCAADGVGYGSSCAVTNATCIVGSSGASCFYNGTACTTPGVDSCNGAALASCTNQMQGFRYDCSAAGLACVTNDAGISDCIAPGCPGGSGCVESCHANGHTMTVCVGGSAYDIDCAMQPGFKSCGSATRSSNKTVYAYCK